MAWQFTTNQPIYLQIVDEIELRIFNGTYEKGAKLPSVRDLALVAAVNPNTMQRALSELESNGLVCTQRNSGRLVTEDESVISAARGEKAKKLIGAFLGNMCALGYQPAETRRLLDEESAVYAPKAVGTEIQEGEKYGSDS